MATREELLAEADALDGEAAAHWDEGPEAIALHRQAAEHRVEALGPKPYPVLVCSECFALTGWLGAAGTCATDLRRRLRNEATNLLGLPDLPKLPEYEQVSVLRRVKRALGIGSAHDRSREWLTKVEPGVTGPVQPEDGWAVEWPVKFERLAPEGPDLLVCFDTHSYRFEYGAWRTAGVTPGGKPRTLVPHEFAASLPMSALAEAWNDFEEEVAEHNRRVWAAEADRREDRRRAELERRRAEELERGTSDLLG